MWKKELAFNILREVRDGVFSNKNEKTHLKWNIQRTEGLRNVIAKM